MSGHPNQGQYDDGYGHHPQGNTDSYYQDDNNQGYYDQNGGYADHQAPQGQHHQGGDGYYDESYVSILDEGERNGTDFETEATTMPMPITHTNKMVDTTRGRNTMVNTKTNTTMTSNTTTKALQLPVSMHKAKALQDDVGIRKRIQRPSATLP